MMIRHILSTGIKPSENAFFTQNDVFYDAGYSGAIEKLQSIGYENTAQIVHARYRRNTVNVEQAVADILLSKTVPKAIIMVGRYGASSAFIKLLKAELPATHFYNISFTGREVLQSIEGDITKSTILNAFRGMKSGTLDIGSTLEYSNDEKRQASQQV